MKLAIKDLSRDISGERAEKSHTKIPTINLMSTRTMPIGEYNKDFRMMLSLNLKIEN